MNACVPKSEFRVRLGTTVSVSALACNFPSPASRATSATRASPPPSLPMSSPLPPAEVAALASSVALLVALGVAIACRRLWLRHTRLFTELLEVNSISMHTQGLTQSLTQGLTSMDSLPRTSPPPALSIGNYESTAAVLLEPLSASETTVPPLSASEKTVLFSAKLPACWPAGFQQADELRSRVSVKLPEGTEVLNPFSPSVCAAPSCPAHRHRVTIGTTSMPADPIQQAEGHASKLNELIAGSIERARQLDAGGAARCG